MHMNKLMKNQNDSQYILVPIGALIIVSVLFPTFCVPKKQSDEFGCSHLNLARSIQNHMQSINQKVDHTPSFENRQINLTTLRTPPPVQDETHSTINTIFAPAQIRGIAYQKNKPLVFIGNRVLQAGDWIGGFKIEEIQRENFTVTDHSGKRSCIQLYP